MLPLVPDNRTPDVAVDREEFDRELEEVDALVRKSLLMGDPSIVFGYVRRIASIGVIKGFAAARILHRTWAEWAKFQAAGVDDEWENYAPAACGLSLDTCRKYRDLYRDVYENDLVPLWVKNALSLKPIESQLRVRSAAKSGELNDEDWEKITNAITPAEVGEIVRVKRGPVTKSETRVVLVLERSGVLKAKRGSTGKYVNVGTLRTSRADTEGGEYENTVRAIAIDRIVKSAGILEQ